MPDSFTGRYWLTFDGVTGQEPLIYRMSKEFDVVFNIKQANIGRDVAIMALELQGDEKTVHEALAWLESHKVRVAPLEMTILEG